MWQFLLYDQQDRSLYAATYFTAQASANDFQVLCRALGRKKQEQHFHFICPAEAKLVTVTCLDMPSTEPSSGHACVNSCWTSCIELVCNAREINSTIHSTRYIPSKYSLIWSCYRIEYWTYTRTSGRFTLNLHSGGQSNYSGIHPE
jgi:hypothetical protein